jgi:hypothetical protein
MANGHGRKIEIVLPDVLSFLYIDALEDINPKLVTDY